ncbi:mediator of RNA polymerase II transcription subunit 25, partial [Tanacetum coccineum]
MAVNNAEREWEIVSIRPHNAKVPCTLEYFWCEWLLIVNGNWPGWTVYDEGNKECMKDAPSWSPQYTVTGGNMVFGANMVNLLADRKVEVESKHLALALRLMSFRDNGSAEVDSPNVELALVVFNAHGSSWLLHQTDWTNDVKCFLNRLPCIKFSGSKFCDAAIAEGLAQALTSSKEKGNSDSVRFKEELRVLDEKIDKKDGSNELVQRRTDLIKNINHLDQIRSMDLAQKSK